MNSFAIAAFVFLGLTGVCTAALIALDLQFVNLPNQDNAKASLEHMAYLTGIVALTLGFFAKAPDN